VPDDLQEWRDIIIIATGGVMITLLTVMLIFTLVVGTAARSLLVALRTLIQSEVTPMLDSARQTLQSVQGTTTFVSESAVRPIIRVYGIIAAIRRALAVLLGLVRRGGRRRRPGKGRRA